MWSPRAHRIAAALIALVASFVVAALATVEAYAREVDDDPAPGSPAAEACAEAGELTDPVELTSVAEVEELVVGTWIRCGDGSMMPPTDGAVGIEFRADGRFHRVYAQGDGTLVRASGLEQEGTWTVPDLSGAYQINLRLLGSGSTFNSPTFFADPPSMSVINTAGTADYVRWTGRDPVDGDPPGVGDDPCANPADPVSPASVAEVEELVVGTWIRCGDASAVPGRVDGAVGFEVRTGGRFHRVYEQADGTLVRASGLEQEGTWSVIDNTAVNGPGSFQIDLDLLGSGVMHHHTTFFATPPFLRLDNMGDPADYLLWTGDAPVDGLPPGSGDEACPIPTDAVMLTSVGHVRELLVGTWVRCDPASWTGDDPVGLHVEADGRWFQVRPAGDGSLVTGEGPGEHGTWSVLDLTDMNGPGSYQLDLVTAAGRTGMSFPTFFDTPPFLRLLGPSGAFDYVPWTGEPVSVESVVTPPTQPTTTATTATTAAEVLGATTTLPRTGADPTMPLLVAATLTVAGVLVLVALRRPPRTSATGPSGR